MRGQRLGAAIGAVGGLLFVLINAGALGGTGSVILRVLGVTGFVAVCWYAIVRTRSWPVGPPPAARAIRVYWICVAAMVLAIPLGAQVFLRALDRPELTPVWVVLVVGAHFIPFARAFGAPVFAWLGLALVAVALLGGVGTVAYGPVAASLTAVVAGFLLLAAACTAGRRASVAPGP